MWNLPCASDFDALDRLHAVSARAYKRHRGAGLGLPVVRLITVPSTAAKASATARQAEIKTRSTFMLPLLSSACRIRRRTSAAAGTSAPQCGQASGSTAASARVARGRRRRLAPSHSAAQLQLDAVHFGHHAGQFALQIPLGLLVVLVGELAQTVFKLQVAQVFVDGGFALVQMLEGRNRFRLGQILGPDRQDEDDRADGDQRMRWR